MANETVRQFYNGYVENEWNRMIRHPVEFRINSEYILRYVKPGMRVLDIGGGPGRYSFMLHDHGCEVKLLDLSDGNVQFAKDEAARRGFELEAVQGDALEASSIAGDGYDAVLLMGPLYHLMTETERERAVREAWKALKPGRMIFAAAITNSAGIMYYLQNNPADILLPGEEVYLEKLEADESYSGPAFTDAHFMKISEFRPLMEGQGFETLHIAGSEGVCSPREKDIAADPQVFERWIKLSLAVCERPEFMGMAEHLLYVGRKAE